MGKKKLNLAPPQNEKVSIENFNRRLPGLLKKATELSFLTSSKIFVMVERKIKTDEGHSDKKQYICYCSEGLETFFASFQHILFLNKEKIIDPNLNLDYNIQNYVLSASTEDIEKSQEYIFIQPEKPILHFKLDYEKSLQHNKPIFLVEKTPIIIDFLKLKDFSKFYVPEAERLSRREFILRTQKPRIQQPLPIETNEKDANLAEIKRIIDNFSNLEPNEEFVNIDNEERSQEETKEINFMDLYNQIKSDSEKEFDPELFFDEKFNQ